MHYFAHTNSKIQEIQQMADELGSKDENIVFEIPNECSPSRKEASMTEVKNSLNSFREDCHYIPSSSQKTLVRKNEPRVSLKRGVSPEISFSP